VREEDTESFRMCDAFGPGTNSPIRDSRHQGLAIGGKRVTVLRVISCTDRPTPELQ